MQVDVTNFENRLDELIRVQRTANAIAVAGQMGLDITNPVDQNKVMRHISGVEAGCGGEAK